MTESSGPTSIIKTQFSSSSDSQGPEVRYRSQLGSRAPRVINRTSYGGGGNVSGGGTRVVKSMSYGYGAGVGSGPASGAYATMSAYGVDSVKTSRETEKRDMQDLNERFANYIEKVRFLEAQNRKLAEELDQLRRQWGRETQSVKTMYQVELDEARKLLDDVEKDKARLEIRNASLEEQLEELRFQIGIITLECEQKQADVESNHSQLMEYESEINLLRRRLQSLEDDRDKNKKKIDGLTEALSKARADLDEESILHVVAENRVQTLEEEIEFLKGVHDQEMIEMAALAYRDTTKESRDFWKNELAQCLREIQEVYDSKLETMRGELDKYYKMKIQEFRTGATRQGMETQHSKEENKKLREQLADMRGRLSELEARNMQLEKEVELLRREYEEKERQWESQNAELTSEVWKLRGEMEAILQELQDLMETKLGLELEIAAYRKLLEGEENRSGFRSIVESMMTSGGSYAYDDDDSSQRVSQVVKGEMSAKTTYQRSAKGPLSISECAADGGYIVIENTGKKEESLQGYRIVRITDGRKPPAEYLFSRCNLGTQKHNSKVKVWAKDRLRNESNFQSLESGNDSWGIGANIECKLFNPAGEERATHNQVTKYQ